MRNFVVFIISFIKLNIFVILFAVSGCDALYYPNMQNVPMFVDSKQSNINLTLNNYQYAHLFKNNFGMTVNGFYRGGHEVGFGLISGDVVRSNYQGEVGISKSFIFKDILDIISTDINGGIGYGHVDMSLTFRKDGSYQKCTSDYYKYYFQPSISLNGTYFCAGLSTRFSLLNFVNNNFNNNDKYVWFFEPAATLKIGKENVFFLYQAQLTYPFPEKWNDIRSDPNASSMKQYDFGLFMSLGIQIRINRK